MPNGEPPGAEAARFQLAYGLGWGLLRKTRYGPAFFKEGHGDGAQTTPPASPAAKPAWLILTNGDNGEFAFRTLLEELWADTEVPWEWECYTPACIERSRQ